MRDAQGEFQEAVGQGKPAAVLEAHDSRKYGTKVSLPPSGRATIEIRLEELLVRKLSRIDFQIPLFPGLEVERLVMDLTIQEFQSGVSSFGFVPESEVEPLDIVLSTDQAFGLSAQGCLRVNH